MMGGMLYVFMYGAGAYSMDAWLGLAASRPRPHARMVAPGTMGR